MSKMRRLFLVGMAVCALPVAAQAQWASSRTEHDWRLSIRGYSFGLVQQAVYTASLAQPSFRQTTVYLGPLGSRTTSHRAAYLVTVVLVPAAAAVALLVMSVLRQKREQGEGAP
jgi:hypothetical protein